MSNLVTLSVDGVEVSVAKGTLVVEAAKQAGNEIPVFCYHSRLESVGMCRMCLVTVGAPARDRGTGELQLDDNGKPVIRFFPKPQTACTTPVSEGMVVITQSEESLADRAAVLEFLLTSHPLDCPVCDKGGECSLQDLAFAHGPGKSRFPHADKHHGPKRQSLGDLIILDTERCVLCTRCVRFQDEIAGDPVLVVENRGRDARIVSYSVPTFDSKYSGNTTDICPVGALTTRDFRFGARAWELTNVASVCNLCGVGCNTVLGTRDDKIKRVMPRQNEAVNEIWLCDKGRFGHHFNASQNRITAPLIKKNGQFVEASWDEALSLVAEKLGAAGANAGGIAGAKLSNEDLYLFQKLFRSALNSQNIDHRVGLNAISDEITHQVGVGVGTDIGRLDKNAAILVVGADLDEEAPALYLRARGAARKDAHLINAGGRWTKLDTIAQTSLRYRYGAEVNLVWAMVVTILEEELWNKEFVAQRVSNFSELQETMKAHSPKMASKLIGIPEEDLRAAARVFAKAENGLILYGLESGGSPALQNAIKTLALVTGHAGRANNGVIAVLPHVNSRGAADLGVLPHYLPGYAPLAEPGLSAQQMLNAESDLSAFYLIAADPAAESESAKAALQAADFVVVQDLFMTPTAQLADIVLPAQAVAERDGSYTSIERWVQAFDAAVPAPPNARADWRIIADIAAKLDADWSYNAASEVMLEINRAVPLYAHTDFENLLSPISLKRKSSHYIYSGTSFTADSREGAQWATFAEQPDSVFDLKFIGPEKEPPQGELVLVAPRVLYDGGTLIGEAEIVAARIQQPQVHLSRSDAKRLTLNDGDEASFSVNGVSLILPVRVNRLVPQGVALLPRNLKGAPAEKLLDGQGLVAEVERVEKPESISSPSPEINVPG
ncbi:MAG: NADH dehydrogenase (quinone) subunit G [Anaerolineaceae bacterium 4572_5.2]|nr:MAG: NADH dehydrogenase (quinone) subunit G [Anaerolineaceae bacterium 4572_5.2]